MKKKVLPVIVAILLILVIGGCALGKVLLDKYSYSKEEADWNEFYQVSENDRSAIILQNEIQLLYTQLIEESKKINIAYNNYNDLVSILEDKKTELRSLRLAKPQRAKLSSVQERKFEEYKAEYTKTEEIIRSCNDEIVKVRKRFNLQNLKLDYEKRYTSQLREISLLVLSYKKRFETVSTLSLIHI